MVRPSHPPFPKQLDATNWSGPSHNSNPSTGPSGYNKYYTRITLSRSAWVCHHGWTSAIPCPRRILWAFLSKCKILIEYSSPRAIPAAMSYNILNYKQLLEFEDSWFKNECISPFRHVPINQNLLDFGTSLIQPPIVVHD